MEKINPVKIGILGEIRSGKDTVSNLMAHELSKFDESKHSEFLAFSSGIHKVIELLFPTAYDNGKPRKYLQDIGQHLRQVEPDVWIDYLFNSVPYQIADIYRYNMFITDVRQANEAERLQAEGYKIIKVVANDEVRAERAKAKGDDFDPTSFTHETELAVHECPYDYLVDNSFTIDDLKQRVVEILEEVVEYE